MKIEDHTKLVESIMNNLTDQAVVSTTMAQITEDYPKVMSELEMAKTTADQLKADNEKLRQANMSLFMQIPQRKAEDNRTTTVDNKTPDNFDDLLFDEKGNIKK
jgi:cell shape-determining protein MreC